MHDGNDPARGEAVGNYSGRLFTDVAVCMINEQPSEEPLFLYLPYQLVHAPIQAPQESIDKFTYIKNINRRTLAGNDH